MDGTHSSITIKPDGVHDLSPHHFKKVQRLKNVTVEILQCKFCGKVSIGWYRQDNTEETEEALQTDLGEGHQ